MQFDDVRVMYCAWIRRTAPASESLVHLLSWSQSTRAQVARNDPRVAGSASNTAPAAVGTKSVEAGYACIGESLRRKRDERGRQAWKLWGGMLDAQYTFSHTHCDTQITDTTPAQAWASQEKHDRAPTLSKKATADRHTKQETKKKEESQTTRIKTQAIPQHAKTETEIHWTHSGNNCI